MPFVLKQSLRVQLSDAPVHHLVDGILSLFRAVRLADVRHVDEQRPVPVDVQRFEVDISAQVAADFPRAAALDRVQFPSNRIHVEIGLEKFTLALLGGTVQRYLIAR